MKSEPEFGSLSVGGRYHSSSGRWPRLLVAAAALALGLAGCSMPTLPGGAPDGPAYQVVVEFTDVLDLVPQSAVKVNDVTVGSVTGVWLSGWTARVRVRIADSVHLPDNATAAIRQTSLLGEKFVALSAPTGEPARGELSDGDVIPLASTRRSAEVEEVLGALGLVLNGGGLDQLRVINAELGSALAGREADAKGALHQLDAFISGLDAQRADIVRAIEAVDRLAARLARQRDTIGAAVDAFGPGLGVLADQRQQLTGALAALDRLSAVGTRVITASRDDTLAILADLRPILDQLVRAGDALPKGLDFLLSYPFPPSITGAIRGDRVNLHVTLDLDAADVLANVLAAAPPTQPGVPVVPGVPVPGLPLPTLPGVPLPTLPVPTLPVPTLSPLPTLPPVPTLPVPTLPPILPGPQLPGLPIAEGAAPLGTTQGVSGSLGMVLAKGLVA